MTDTSPSWIREALQNYFELRPGIHVDSVDLIGYFRVASVLAAADDLVAAGWLVRTNGPYPKLKRSPDPSCSDCGAQIPDPAERWPSATEGTICQVCWETQCDRQWWAMVRLLPEEEAND